MPNFLVLTLIGDDRPGLVEQLSAVITAHQGSWLESSMAQLAGKFAGVLKVSVAADQVETLTQTLNAFSALKVTATTAIADTVTETSKYKRRLSFSLVGHHRIGIVREVSQVFARHNVTVEKLITYTSSPPMSSEMLFHADAELNADEKLDAAKLQADLEHLSNDLIADINLDERIR